MYKRRMLGFIACGLLISTTLIACSDEQSTVNAENESVITNGHRQIDHLIVVDKETGCQYIQGVDKRVPRSVAYITPRLNQDGVPMCR